MHRAAMTASFGVANAVEAVLRLVMQAGNGNALNEHRMVLTGWLQQLQNRQPSRTSLLRRVVQTGMYGRRLLGRTFTRVAASAVMNG
jgi:hypothetical protein